MSIASEPSNVLVLSGSSEMKRVSLDQLQRGDKIMVTYDAIVSRVIQEEDGHLTIIGRLGNSRTYMTLFEDVTPNLLVWKKNE